MTKYMFHCSHEINACADDVWRVLTDFDDYPHWNPMIVGLDGITDEGRKLRFTVRQLSGKRITLSAVFMKIEAPTELRWGGGMPGLLYGEHYFVIEPEGEDRCKLHHGEDWSGMLMPLLWWWLEPRGKPLYPAMSEALKERVEMMHPRTT